MSGVGFVMGMDLRGLVHINDQCFIHLCAKALKVRSHNGGARVFVSGFQTLVITVFFSSCASGERGYFGVQLLII